MSRPSISLPTTARSRLAAWLASALAALLASVTSLLFLPSGAQAGPLPTPTSIRIDQITSPRSAPTFTPDEAVPNLLVQVDDVISVHVSFWEGTSEAAFNKDTALKLTTNVGSLTVLDATVTGGQTSAILTAQISDAVNQVIVSVDDFATGKKASDILGDTADDHETEVFDVVYLVLSDTSASSGYQRGIGGDQACTEATRADPVCGIVLLPFGAQAGVSLSTGLCGAADDAYAPCVKGSGVVLQVLAGMAGLGYGPTTPATLLVKCDKSLCGSGGIQRNSLNFSFGGNDSLTEVEPCPAKGTLPPVPPGELSKPCVDYVQSKRDGSGDTYLYFLFDRDARVSVG